jgi:hypothetical protein
MVIITGFLNRPGEITANGPLGQIVEKWLPLLNRIIRVQVHKNVGN